MSIEKILAQLKQAQNEINTYAKVYEEVAQKDHYISKLIEREQEFHLCIGERDDQIEELESEKKEMKIKYEQIIRESMQNANGKVLEDLHILMKNCRRNIEVVTRTN